MIPISFLLAFFFLFIVLTSNGFQHVSFGKLTRGKFIVLQESKGGKGFGVKKSAVEVTAADKSDLDSKSNEDVKDSETPTLTTFESKFESTKYYKSEMTKRQTELDEKISKLREEEALMASDPSVGAVPELVANRMLGRIVVLAGIPVFGGLAIFVGAFFYSKKYDLVVPPAIIAYATQLPFILGLLGITYGILSSSWDKEDGSLLGISEFKTNVQRVKDGLTRTGETAKLREEIDRESDRLGRRK